MNYKKKSESLLDIDAFVFSLNQKKRFFSKDKNVSIRKYGNYCVIFGNGCNSLQIENNILSYSKHWSNPNGSYGNNLNLTEDKYFSIIEFEVFHIRNYNH